MNNQDDKDRVWGSLWWNPQPADHAKGRKQGQALKAAEDNLLTHGAIPNELREQTWGHLVTSPKHPDGASPSTGPSAPLHEDPWDGHSTSLGQSPVSPFSHFTCKSESFMLPGIWPFSKRMFLTSVFNLNVSSFTFFYIDFRHLLEIVAQEDRES